MLIFTYSPAFDNDWSLKAILLQSLFWFLSISELCKPPVSKSLFSSLPPPNFHPLLVLILMDSSSIISICTHLIFASSWDIARYCSLRARNSDGAVFGFLYDAFWGTAKVTRCFLSPASFTGRGDDSFLYDVWRRSETRIIWLMMLKRTNNIYYITLMRRFTPYHSRMLVDIRFQALDFLFQSVNRHIIANIGGVVLITIDRRLQMMTIIQGTDNLREVQLI